MFMPVPAQPVKEKDGRNMMDESESSSYGLTGIKAGRFKKKRNWQNIQLLLAGDVRKLNSGPCGSGRMDQFIIYF